MNRVVVVLGMHRSGTSLVADIVSRAGLSLPSDILPPHPIDNPGGYFESERVAAINKRALSSLGLTWKDANPIPSEKRSGNDLIDLRTEACAFFQRHFSEHLSLVLKDPRLCRLFFLWEQCLARHDAEIHVVRVVRRYESVFQSLAQREKNPLTRGAGIAEPQHAAMLWLRYNIEAFVHALPYPSHVVAYEELLDSPHASLERLGGFLGAADLQAVALPLIRNGNKHPHLYKTHLPADTEALLEEAYLALCEHDGFLDLPVLQKRMEEVSVPAPHQEIGHNPGPKAIAAFCSAALKEISGTIRHSPPQLLGNSDRPGLSTEGRAVWIFVTHSPLTRGTIYRVKNPVDALNRIGQPACWTTKEHALALLSKLREVRTLVVHRCPWDHDLAKLFDEARRRGIRVCFDIDDLVFTREIVEAGWFHYLADKTAQERKHWLSLVDRLRETAVASDLLLVPTATLAESARSLGRPVFEIPNGFSAENLALSEIWLDRKSRSGQVFHIGYASGSPTHDRDFSQVVKPLNELMRANRRIRLTIVGQLGREVVRELPEDQVVMRPLVAHVNLAYELSRFDLNLAPLESNPFCDAKSPLKFFEAALVGVPSLVTDNRLYGALISHGENGLLAKQASDWESGIRFAMESGKAAEMGAIARQAVVEAFSSERWARELTSIVP